MKNLKLPPNIVLPKNNSKKNNKCLSELSLKVMQIAVFNNTDNPLNTEDYVSLSAAIEVYARWLEAQEIINTEGKTNDRQMKALKLLGLDKSRKKEINDSELRHLYLCKTEYIKKTSKQDRIKAVQEIKKELNKDTHSATITALYTAFKDSGLPKVKLPYKNDMDYLDG